MGNESEEHLNARKELADLGRNLGFDVELPDDSEIYYETNNQLKGKKPDVIWNALDIPRHLSKDCLELGKGRILFEVERLDMWRHIKEHIDNIADKDFYVLQFYAVFYDGKLKQSRKKELRDYAKNLSIPLRMFFLSDSEIRKIEKFLESEKGVLEELEKINDLLEIIKILRNVSKSEIIDKISNKKESDEVMIGPDNLPKKEREACESLGIAKVKEINFRKRFFKLKTTEVGQRLIGNIDNLKPPKENRYSSLPTFTKIKKVHKKLNQYELSKENKGIEISRSLIDLTVSILEKKEYQLNKEEQLEVFKIIKEKDIWNEILDDIIKLKNE